MAANDLIILRRGTASEWTATNPVLASGEPGYDLTNRVLKLGDGTSTWNTLTSINLSTANITNFNSAVSGLLQITNILGGSNITISQSGTTYTIAVTGSLGLTTEEVDDRVASLLVAGSGISLNYNDSLNILTINTSGLQPSGQYSVVGHNHTSSQITDFNSSVSGLVSGIYAPINNPTFTGTVNGITKNMFGLSNVDNTSDANKPISNAVQTALDNKAVLSHTHGNITNAGAIGSVANLPLITTTAGLITTGSFGSTANTFCQGNDSRLSDTRTPTDNTVSTAKIINGNVTYAKIQNVSATDRLLGRSSAGSGVVEEITCTSFARSLLDDSDAATARSTLGISSIPTKTIAFFTASDNQPPASNYATLDTRNSILVLDFDGGSINEEAVFMGVIPDNANLSSGLDVSLNWMATSSTTGQCRWGIQFEKMTSDTDADSFDTATEANATPNATAGIPTITTITCTNIDSLAAGDFFRVKIYRDASDTTNDTMTGDAELISVELRTKV